MLGAATLGAQAAAFTSISQTQSVSISGRLSAFDPFTGTSAHASFADERLGPQAPLASHPLELGLGITLPDHPDYSAHGQGLSRQQVELGGDFIRFQGSADVNIYGSYSGAGAVPEGDGISNVRWDYQFSVAEATPVQLRMSSSAAFLESPDFRFSLSRVGGATLWNSALDEDAAGLPTREVDEHFLLGPGVYAISTWVHADSSLHGDLQRAGNTTAQFVLRAVPEPGIWMMLCAGLGLLGWQARRPRQA
jgi:hypothetical protein